MAYIDSRQIDTNTVDHNAIVCVNFVKKGLTKNCSLLLFNFLQQSR